METTPQQKEFVYFWHTPEAAYESEYFIARPIIKKTAKKVFVAYNDYRIFTLDRQELEQEGSVWHRQQKERWYSEAGKAQFEKEQDELHTPKPLKKLGLTKYATEAEIKKAYHRLSKQCHPDAGGTHQAFIELQTNYENALEYQQRKRLTMA